MIATKKQNTIEQDKSEKGNKILYDVFNIINKLHIFSLTCADSSNVKLCRIAFSFV